MSWDDVNELQQLPKVVTLFHVLLSQCSITQSIVAQSTCKPREGGWGGWVWNSPDMFLLLAVLMLAVLMLSHVNQSYMIILTVTLVIAWYMYPRPQATPRFYLTAAKKNREKAWDRYYFTDQKWWTPLLYEPSKHYVLPVSTISGPWRSNDSRLSPDFSLRLWNKIWEWPGDDTSLIAQYTIPS